jgi:hypothetical protein
MTATGICRSRTAIATPWVSCSVGLPLCTVRFKAAAGISHCVEVEVGRHAGPSTRSPRPKSTVTARCWPRNQSLIASM